MPSSSAHDSSRASWKYTSAKSTEWLITSPNTRSRRVSSSPLGRRMTSRAMLRGSETEAGVFVVMQGLQHTMVEGRKASAGVRLSIQVNIRHDAALSARQALQDRAPVIDDHAVAVGLPAVRMKPRLRRRYHVAQVLDGTRPEQRLPVRTPRGSGERRRHRDDLRARGAEPTKQFGEPHVVAHRKADDARRCFDDDGLAPWRDV